MNESPPPVPPGTPQPNEGLPFETAPQPKKKMSGCALAAIIGGVVVVLMIAGCGAIGFFGLKIFNDQVTEALNQNPVILEQIGEVEKLKMDFQSTGAAGAEEFGYKIEGPLGKGKVIVELDTVDAETEEIISGKLTMEDGQTYDLMGGLIE